MLIRIFCERLFILLHIVEMGSLFTGFIPHIVMIVIRKIKMTKVKISAISYLNSVPFVYGIMHGGLMDSCELSLDIPSVCARKLKENEADLGLVPVAALLDMKSWHVVSDYCIGAVGPARSVLLLSKVPLQQIKEIHLDFHSMTSAGLIRILAARYWKIKPEFKLLSDVSPQNYSALEAVLLIGDKTFEDLSAFPYVYDLAEQWLVYTGMPFVFAVWAANKPLEHEFVQKFNSALAYGFENLEKALLLSEDMRMSKEAKLHYLTHNISYQLNSEKRKALELYLSMLEALTQAGR
jgi:chorismate dehydratase